MSLMVVLKLCDFPEDSGTRGDFCTLLKAEGPPSEVCETTFAHLRRGGGLK